MSTKLDCVIHTTVLLASNLLCNVDNENTGIPTDKPFPCLGENKRNPFQPFTPLSIHPIKFTHICQYNILAHSNMNGFYGSEQVHISKNQSQDQHEHQIPRNYPKDVYAYYITMWLKVVVYCAYCVQDVSCWTCNACSANSTHIFS